MEKRFPTLASSPQRRDERSDPERQEAQRREAELQSRLCVGLGSPCQQVPCMQSDTLGNPGSPCSSSLSPFSSAADSSPSVCLQQRKSQLGGDTVSPSGVRLSAGALLREEHRLRQLERAEERSRAREGDACHASPLCPSVSAGLLAEASESGEARGRDRRQLVVPHTNVLPLNVKLLAAQREGRAKFGTEKGFRGGQSQESASRGGKNGAERRLGSSPSSRGQDEGSVFHTRNHAAAHAKGQRAGPPDAAAELPSCVNEEGKQIQPRDFVEFIRSHRSLTDEFCYMNRTGAYSYRIVPFAEKNPTDFLTLSSRGVAHYREGETEFHSLQAWEQDQEKFRRIISIPFFSNYHKWRILSIWKAVMREVRFRLCASILQKNLFSLDGVLRKTLLNIRACGTKLAAWPHLLLHGEGACALDLFLELQASRRQHLVAELRKVWRTVTAELSRACSESLQSFLEANGFPARKTSAGEPSENSRDAPLSSRRGDAPLRSGQPDDCPAARLSRDASALSRGSRASGPPASYTVKATARLQCRKLAKFVKVTEYLLLDALVTFVKGSTARFAATLEAFAKAKALPSASEAPDLAAEQIEVPASPPSEWRGRHRTPRNEQNSCRPAPDGSPPPSNKALFLLHLQIDANGLTVTPNKATFRSAIETVLLENFKAVATMPALTEAPEVAAFVAQAFPGESAEKNTLLFASFFPTNDTSFLDVVKRVGKTVDTLFHQVMQTAEQFSHLVSLYTRCEATTLASFNENDLAAFDDTLAQYLEKIEEISAMPQQLKVGAFCVDTSNVRKVLLPSLKRVVSVIQEHLPTLAGRVMTTLLQAIKGANTKLGEVPTDIDSYVQFNAYLQEVKGSAFSEYEARCSFVSDIFDLVKKFSVKIDAALKTQFVELSQALNTLRTQIQFAVSASETNTQRFFEELEAAVPEAEAKLSDVRMQLDSVVFSTDTADVDAVLAVLESLDNDVAAVTAKVEKCRRCQEVLRTETSAFADFDDLVRTFTALQTFFTAKKSWASLCIHWGNQAFATADVHAIEAQVQSYVKQLNRLQRTLGSNAAFQSMQTDVLKFRSFLPVVVALRSPALMPRHWEKIRDFFDASLELQSSSLLLKDLLDADVTPFIQDIMQIAADASAEKALEAMLESVKETWTTVQLVTTVYKASKDKVPILGSLEEVLVVLDDSLATLATISGSRAARTIQADVEFEHEKLLVFQETLEEWQVLQRNWLYLEPIFASADIRKQLPSEAAKFAGVDQEWRALMKETQEYSLALAAGAKEGRLATFQRMNQVLDAIRKALEDYLQHKREAFPRFFFLSSDELLEMLSQAKNLAAIQPLIRNCFANTYELGIQEEAKLTEIVSMISAEGEEVLLAKALKPRGSVEKWLPEFEEMMFCTVKRNLRSKRGEAVLSRREWVSDTPCQVAACVAQIRWVAQTEEALASHDVHSKLTQHYQRLRQQLQELTEIVRDDLTTLERRTVSALAIQELHNRDVVAELIDAGAESCTHFTWTQQLRHYWDEEQDACVVEQMEARFDYGNEFLGAPTRLVVTPLTDRCWLTITSCLKLLKLSSSVAGPAGAGKTETVKELARMLGYFCLVFNCSESVDLYILEKVFSGVVSSGCWTCLDEFNRLDVDVLSVVAQQLQTLRHCLLKEESRGCGAEVRGDAQSSRDSFLCASRLSRVRPSSAIFITMNPGYAGRTELPDNLKLLFRNVAMIVPDYTSIAETLLFSEGFADAKRLAEKLIKVYKSCSEQLSQQAHYDFGLRSVKTVLLLAGELRRQDPSANEESLLIRAICDANEPKFVEEDLPLFYSTLSDFFPSYRGEAESDEEFNDAYFAAVEARGLQASASSLTATRQLSKLLRARVGTVLLGAPMSGKSTAILLLADVLSRLSRSPRRRIASKCSASRRRRPTRRQRVECSAEARAAEGAPEPSASRTWGASFAAVRAGGRQRTADEESTEESEEASEEDSEGDMENEEGDAEPADGRVNESYAVCYRVVNPKALSISALFGKVDSLTQEWSDGVAARMVREFAASESGSPKWIVFDGPVDSLWIESMNTALDDNQMLCLPNGERIKLLPEMRLLFEATDLHAASPATISRCGMLHFPSRGVSWESLVRSWLNRLPHDPFTEELREELFEYFRLVVPATLTHFQAETLESEIASPFLSLVSSLCNILQAVLHIPLDPTAERRLASGGPKEDRELKAGRRRTTTTPFSAAASPGRSACCTALDISPDLLRLLLLPAFAFSFIWSFGGALKSRSSRFFGKLVEEFFQDRLALPRGDDVFDFALNFASVFGEGYSKFFSQTSLSHDACREGSGGEHSNDPGSEEDREALKRERRRSSSGPGRTAFGEAKLGAGWEASELEKARKTLHAFLSWETLVPAFSYDPSQPFFSLLVPTKEFARATFLLDKMIEAKKSIFLTGAISSGKTTVMTHLLDEKREAGTLHTIRMCFCARTKADEVQQTIELKLEKKRKNQLSPPAGRECVLFVDDVNLPLPEKTGAQPAIEFLRQIQEFKGFYDSKKIHWNVLEKCLLLLGGAPPSSGRKPLPPRFCRHSLSLRLAEPDNASAQKMFLGILTGFFEAEGVNADIRFAAKPLVDATIELYTQVKETFLPTPPRSVYVFSFRHVKTLFQGILAAKKTSLPDKEAVLRLWIHEACRTFYDRLMTEEDRQRFRTSLISLVNRKFSLEWDETLLVYPGSRLWGSFVSPERLYEEAPPPKVILPILETFRDELFASSGATEAGARNGGTADTGDTADSRSTGAGGRSAGSSLVFFSEAVENLFKLCRILMLARGNALLVGVGGTGKQTLFRLAAFIQETSVPRLTETSVSVLDQFRECEKSFMLQSGLSRCLPTAFLLTETQIVDDGILQDINTLLSTGEISSALDAETVDKIVEDLLPSAKETRRDTSRDGLVQLFQERVALNLHVVLSMSPAGSALRERLRCFPALLSCCSVVFFDSWSKESLSEVARDFFATQDSATQDARASTHLCVQMHQTAIETSKAFLTQLNRPVYVTPKCFLDLIGLVVKLKHGRQEALQRQRSLLSAGLTRLHRTNAQVEKLREELEQLKPVLETKHVESEQLLATVESDRAAACSEQERVAAERRLVMDQQQEVSLLQSDAQKDVDAAMPALEAALASLDALDKKDLTEMKSFAKPPPLVVATMEVVNLLLGEKTDWDSARRVLSDSGLMTKLKNYDKDHISPGLLKKLDKLLQRSDYTPEQVGKQSAAAMSLCMWTLAIQTYAKVVREVQPKREKLAAMNEMLDRANAQLAEAEDKLSLVMAKVQAMEERLATLNAEKEKLLEETTLCQQRLNRAGMLTSGLAEEAARWKNTISVLNEQLVLVEGDAFLAAASICYCGPFTGRFRGQLHARWTELANHFGIACAENFSLTEVLSDPIELRDWDLQGLPSDRTSLESGVLVRSAGKLGRAPLVIDPQQQAKKWIKNREAENGLRVLDLSHPKLQTILTSSVRVGQPVLLEDVGESLPPILDSVLLLPSVRTVASNPKIKIGEKAVELDPNFSLFLSTKLANPHYLPEVALKVLLVNFTVTPEGLEQQLLTEVVRLEMPDTEKRGTEILVQISKDKRVLKHLEELILQLLSETGGNILDDEKVVQALHRSRSTAESVARRLQDAESILEEVQVARQFYSPVASRAALLYFVVASLSEVESMYQYSLEFFTLVFRESLKRENADAASLQARRESLLSAATHTLFANVARGLFHPHKLLFAFLLAVEILKQERANFQHEAWQVFLRGVSRVGDERVPANPLPSLFSETEWRNVHFLEANLEVFSGLGTHIEDHTEAWLLWIEGDMSLEATPFPFCGLSEEAKLLPQLLLVKAIRSRQVIPAVQQLIVKVLGEAFVDFSPSRFQDLFAATCHTTPLLFILSPGVDPSSSLFKFAREHGIPGTALHSVSLGRGQGPKASRILECAMRDGSWVLLQNCHLAKSWLPVLERLVFSLSEAESSPSSCSPRSSPSEVPRNKERDTPLSPKFRLFLTSMPAPYIPVSVLQNSLKVTLEPPSGLRANLKRSIMNTTQEDLDLFGRAPEGVPGDVSGKADAWTRIRFALQFFHAVVQGRRTFGALGWNAGYHFSDSDLDASIVLFKTLFRLQEKVEDFDFLPLQYLVGNINYGGCITDEWDRRCLTNLLSLYVSPEVVLEEDALSHLGLQRVPYAGSLEALNQYVETLPVEDKPEVFGLHPNATLRLHQERGASLIQTVLAIASRENAAASVGSAREDQTLQFALLMKQKLPPLLKGRPVSEETFEAPSGERPIPSDGTPAPRRGHRRGEISRLSGAGEFVSESEQPVKPESMAAFLFQETERFNALINLVGETLQQLELAVKGLISITGELDEMHTCISNNQVPPQWTAQAYPSLKPLGSWFEDFLQRVAALRRWTEGEKPPVAFWLSGFFFPQGFLTAVLQNYARKVSAPIDALGFTFHVMSTCKPEELVEEDTLEDSCYVYGLYIDGARWNYHREVIDEQLPGATHDVFPVIQFQPGVQPVVLDAEYTCPVYKTMRRAGVLSSTGHSTNFITAIDLPTDQHPSKWILRGTALICSVED
ncbi:UNVERIFIED_CONTAM: ATPase family associated with various cellular activities (AAA) domain-containing protein [Hammondia hammondi]|eukprot:XP_008884075.1 ATPase family associated with various cellular activities (AAA) domain-containing protein [Hammondia hammondi]